MKTLFKNSIDEKNNILEIDKIILDYDKSKKIFDFFKDLKKLDDISGKANFLKTKNEKQDFIKEVKNLDNYNEIAKDKFLLENMISNNYLEFLLPYFIEDFDLFSSNDTYKNVEIIGIGFYENNLDIL
jgi:hypothetical protein